MEKEKNGVGNGNGNLAKFGFDRPKEERTFENAEVVAIHFGRFLSVAGQKKLVEMTKRQAEAPNAPKVGNRGSFTVESPGFGNDRLVSCRLYS